MRIFGFDVKRAKTKTTVSQLQDFSWRSVFSTPEQNDLYSGWVYACVRAIAEEVAKIQLILKRKKSDGSFETLTSHPALDLLYYVNDYFTRYQLFERLQSNLELYGNEYWFLERTGSKITSIIPLYPKSVKPIEGDHYVIGYEYTRRGKRLQLGLDEIIHFRNYNPLSDCVGLSTLSAARIMVDTDNASKEYNKQLVQNDATPSGLLRMKDEVSDDAAQQILDKWNQRHQGEKRAGKIGLLSGDMEFVPMSISPTDLQYVEQSKMHRDDILAIFRVGKTILGIIEDVNYAGAQTSNYVFSLRVVEPKQRKIVDTLNEFYLPFWNDQSLIFDYESPVHEDDFTKVQANAIRMQQGVMTLNEWREQDGRLPLKDGDSVFLPYSVAPYSEPIEQDEENKQVPNLDLKAHIEKAIQSHAHTLIPVTKNSTSTTPIADATVSANHSQPFKNRTYAGMSVEKFDQLGEKINQAQRKRENEYIKRMVKLMQGLFDDQKNEVLTNVRRYVKGAKVQSTKAKLPDFLDVSKALKVTIDLVTPLMNEIFKKEGENAYASLGLHPGAFDTHTPTAQEFLKNNPIKFAGSVTDYTTERVRKEIADGLDAGEGIAEITKRIQDVSVFDDARAEKIALTETHRAAGEAEMEAFIQSDVVVSKVWFTAMDERVCDECESMNGVEVAVDDYFLSTDQLSDFGIQAYNDEDLMTADLHPMCRCSVIPVIKD